MLENGKKIDRPTKNGKVPHNLSQGDKLSLSDQILAQTVIIYIYPAPVK